MAFTTNPYCTLAQVKTALAIPTTDTDDDAWITNDLMPEAQDMIDDCLGFGYQTDGVLPGSPATRTYSGQGHTSLLIDPLMTLSQVLETSYDNVLITSGGVQVIASGQVDITSDCVVGPNNVQPGIVLKRLSGEIFRPGTNNYQVLGVYGYPTAPNIPREIERAAIRLVCHLYKMRDSNYADALTQTGGVRLKYNKQMPDDVMEILNRKAQRRFRSR